MSDFESVGHTVGVVMDSVKAARDAYAKARLRVIPVLCGDCGVDSPQMRSCHFSADPECKHKPLLDRRVHAKSQLARCRAAKVPAKYHDEVLSIDPCAALHAVRGVLSGAAQAAVLLGNPGSGKTLCAAYALAERGGLFCPASSLDVLSAETANLIERLCAEPMAVLDDVGRGRSATILALDRTEDILCRRFDAGLPTIVTANVTRPEFWGLHAVGGGRVLDRIGEKSITLCREASRRQPEIDHRPYNERGER